MAQLAPDHGASQHLDKSNNNYNLWKHVGRRDIMMPCLTALFLAAAPKTTISEADSTTA